MSVEVHPAPPTAGNEAEAADVVAERRVKFQHRSVISRVLRRDATWTV